MSPPWRSTIFFTMDMPRPVPDGLVVKNGRKILSRSSGAIPMPSSTTSTTARSRLREQVDLTRPAPRPRLDGLQRVLHDVGEDLAQLLAVRRPRPRRRSRAPVARPATPRLAPRAAAASTTGSRMRASSYSLRSSRVSRVEVEEVVDDALDLRDAGRGWTAPSPGTGGSPSTSGEDSRLVAILIPPSGLRISWATPAAISPERGELLALDQPPLRLHLLGEVAQHAHRAHRADPAVVEEHGEGQVGREDAGRRAPAARDLPAPAAPHLERRPRCRRAARVGGGEQVADTGAGSTSTTAWPSEPAARRVHGDEPAGRCRR